MMRTRRRSRRGFSLVEVITALTILGIIGVALTKMILTQTRSFQYENSSRRARTASRSAMNILASDLRMTQDVGGLDSVDVFQHRWIDLKVPVAFGILCQVNAGSAVIALVPVDSFQVASSKYGGYAVRNKAASTYAYARAGASDTIQVVPPAPCRTNGIFADTVRVGGRVGSVVSVSPAPPAGTVVGDPAFVWHHVRYQFASSSIYPDTTGRSLGLWRRLRGRANTDSLREELIAPFNKDARFNYYTNPPAYRDTALKVAPANMNLIRGFQIYLPAQSSDTLAGRKAPQRVNTTMSVYFKNTRVQ
jgi:prepilin-type N-terminal cleavage/methylation domain-containing protein